MIRCLIRGGWVQALPCLHQGLALPFHVGLHPALEHIDHLELDVVEMQL